MRSSNGYYYQIVSYGYWWSSTIEGSSMAWRRFLYAYDAKVNKFYNEKTFGFSVRCVCDSLATQTKYINYNEGIKIYPNPATDRIVIDCAERQNLKLSVYNLVGILMLEKNYNSTTVIDISSLSKGIYIIKISGTDWIVQEKLIKN